MSSEWNNSFLSFTAIQLIARGINKKKSVFKNGDHDN